MLRRTLSSRQTFLAKFIVPIFFFAAAAVVPFIFMTSDLPLTWLNVLLTLIFDCNHHRALLGLHSNEGGQS